MKAAQIAKVLTLKSCVSILPSASRKHFKSALASVAISLPLVVMELKKAKEEMYCTNDKTKKELEWKQFSNILKNWATFSQTTFPFIHVLTVVKLFGSFLDGSDVSFYNCSNFKGTLMCTLAHF